jgi:hypothetical protein
VVDPRRAQRRELADVLVAVVRTEGPILAHRAYRLIVQAGGGQRLTHAAISPLNKACALADREGRLVAVQSPIKGGLINSLLRLPSQPEVVVRIRGPRSLEEIPWGEVQAVAARIRHDRPALDGVSLLRAILERYERVALTEAAKRYLDVCLAAPTVREQLTPTPGLELSVKSRVGVGKLPSVGHPPMHAAVERGATEPDFAKVLAGLITRAQRLAPTPRAALAAAWVDDDVASQRRKVVEAATRRGAPRDWTVAARAVTATLDDFAAKGRAAIVDAAYAQTADEHSIEKEILLRPWRTALGLEIGAGTTEVMAVPSPEERCPHGRLPSMCTTEVCSRRFLGTAFEDDWRAQR